MCGIGAMWGVGHGWLHACQGRMEVACRRQGAGARVSEHPIAEREGAKRDNANAAQSEGITRTFHQSPTRSGWREKAAAGRRCMCVWNAPWSQRVVHAQQYIYAKATFCGQFATLEEW